MDASEASLSAVWAFADGANGLMPIPNLIPLLALNGVLVAATKHSLWALHLDENRLRNPDQTRHLTHSRFVRTIVRKL